MNVVAYVVEAGSFTHCGGIEYTFHSRHFGKAEAIAVATALPPPYRVLTTLVQVPDGTPIKAAPEVFHVKPYRPGLSGRVALWWWRHIRWRLRRWRTWQSP